MDALKKITDFLKEIKELILILVGVPALLSTISKDPAAISLLSYLLLGGLFLLSLLLIYQGYRNIEDSYRKSSGKAPRRRRVNRSPEMRPILVTSVPSKAPKKFGDIVKVIWKLSVGVLGLGFVGGIVLAYRTPLFAPIFASSTPTAVTQVSTPADTPAPPSETPSPTPSPTPTPTITITPTPFVTLTPTETPPPPTATVTPVVLFEDDFSNKSKGWDFSHSWDETTKEEYFLSISNGALLQYVNCPAALTKYCDHWRRVPLPQVVVEEFIMDFDAKVTKLSPGKPPDIAITIQFHYSAAVGYYYLQLRPLSGSYEVCRSESGGSCKPVVTGKTTAMKGADQFNHFCLVVHDEYFEVYANGQLVRRVNEAVLREGQIHLGVLAPNGSYATVVMDNLRIVEAP